MHASTNVDADMATVLHLPRTCAACINTGAAQCFTYHVPFPAPSSHTHSGSRPPGSCIVKANMSGQDLMERRFEGVIRNYSKSVSTDVCLVSAPRGYCAARMRRRTSGCPQSRAMRCCCLNHAHQHYCYRIVSYLACNPAAAARGTVQHHSGATSATSLGDPRVACLVACPTPERCRRPTLRVVTACSAVQDVEKLRGSIKIEHTLARMGAERLWKLINTEAFVPALGALTGNMAVQQVAGACRHVRQCETCF